MANSTVSLTSDFAVRPAQTRSYRALIFVGIAIALLATFPFFAKDYLLFQATLVIASAIAVLGLNLLTGYNGQISLGHGAFFAIGSYAAAIAMERLSLPYYLAIPVAGVCCLVFGVLFGLPALRLEGLYLAIATLALGVSLPQLLKYKRIAEYTGGVQGIAVEKPEAPIAGINADQWLYLFTLGVAVILFLVARNIVRSHAGRAMMAIRDQPTAAAAMGINLARYKTITFGISAMYTGIAGALTALAVQFIAPDSFGMHVSINFLVGMVVGGLGQLAGAVFGALFIHVLPVITEELSKSATLAIYGFIMIVCINWMPYGISGFLAQTAMRIRARLQGQAND
jgi:branched-chain amino acid transport system permease protein